MPFGMVRYLKLPVSCHNNPFRYQRTSSLLSKLFTLQRQKLSRRRPTYLWEMTSQWKRWQKLFGVLPPERQESSPV